VSLYRRGDTPQARAALARAVEALPDDLGRWVDLGRLLGRIGWAEESATILAKARSLGERRLSRAPDDAATAADLAYLLPEADASAGWTVLRPDVMTSAAGATLTRLPDGSILAGGPNPHVDTYTIEATSGRSGITGLRLEVLPDASLPDRGPGRATTGKLFLGEVRLSSVGPSAPVPIHLTRARADLEGTINGPRRATDALDADATTAWAIWPVFGRPHRAVFQAVRPIGIDPGTRLHIELVCGLAIRPHETLGRFRLSVTDRPFPLFEPSLQRIKADTERDGRTRLGVAYALLGEWAPAAAVLARAAARPDASALDDFLVALARHHVGRVDEARSDCDRAVGRLGSDLADEATHDVAVEALMTIRGMGLDEAESALLDLVFPAEPFVPPSSL
jgi:hypothetical protein